LNYKGSKPGYEYYGKNFSKYHYDLIPNDNWDCQLELLKYLKSDVEGLFEVLIKITVSIFERFNINMTKFKTQPSLAMGIFTSNFYNEDFEINMIKGTVEKDLRSASYGGIVLWILILNKLFIMLSNMI